MVEHIGDIHASDTDAFSHAFAHDLGTYPSTIVVDTLFRASHERLAVVGSQRNPTGVDLTDWHIRALFAKSIEHTTRFEFTARGEHRDLKVHCGRSTYNGVQPHRVHSKLTQDVFFLSDFIVSDHQASSLSAYYHACNILLQDVFNIALVEINQSRFQHRLIRNRGNVTDLGRCCDDGFSFADLDEILELDSLLGRVEFIELLYVFAELVVFPT